VVREVLAGFRVEIERSGCTVSFRSPGPVTGRWDHGRLEQVVSNLMSNALKFGSGRPIEIDVSASDGTARLTVADHGIGIDADNLGRIFERFERAVSAGHYGGLGLGLYIAREIVTAFGGSIRAEGAPGQGATFFVELPQGGPPEKAPAAAGGA
jgi:signal transduction histidine kinase